MTRYVVNSSEVYHLWAHQAQGEARNSSGSVSFRGNVAFSYGAVIGKIVTNRNGQRAYLVSSSYYSSTTSQHQSMLRSAIPSGAVVFNHAGLPCLEAAYPQVLGQMIGELPELRAKADRARENKERRLTDLRQQVDLINNFAAFFGLEHTPIATGDIIREIEKERSKPEEGQVQRNELRKKSLEKQAEKEQEALAKWIKGEAVRIGKMDYAYLRIVPSSTDLTETTMGAVVPTHRVRNVICTVLAIMKRCRDRSEEWVPLKQMRLGLYSISWVDTCGILVVGCHRFTIEEVERFLGVLRQHYKDMEAQSQNQGAEDGGTDEA